MVGLIDKATEVAEKTEIAQEKEQIQFAVTSLTLENKEMNAENLQKELNNSSENTDIKVEQVEENSFLVTFPSGRVYEVADGNVEYVGKEGKLQDVIIQVNKESDLTEKQIQEVEVTIKTYNNPEIAKTVKLEYAWNNNKENKPSSYQTVNTEGNNITKKATISSGEQKTGNYYLWIRVTVNGKTVEKTYGEYYIKKYATLLSTAKENSATASFLGNASIQRGKIKTITLQNTKAGKSVDQDKCWDVSTTQNEEILAWYEEEKIGEDTYYNVTIGADGKIRANENSRYLFAYIGNEVTGTEVKIEGLENLDTSNIKFMDYMFAQCKNIKNLDLKSFNTSNVTNMRNVFNNCSSLASLDLSNFNTSRVTDMGSMFAGCSVLISLNLSNFNTSKLTDMSSMFYHCMGLTSLDLSSFDTSNVKNMSNLFQLCRGLENVNVSHFNTENVTNMSSMFYECVKLQKIDVRHFDTSNVTTMMGMFRDCRLLQDIDVSNFKTNKVETMLWMFYGCSNLQRINVNNFNTSNVWNLDGMFQKCSKLQNIDLSNFDVIKVTDIRNMFDGCSNLQELNLKNWELSENARTESMFESVHSNIVIKVSTQTMKNKLMSIYEEFTNSNFLISE